MCYSNDGLHYNMFKDKFVTPVSLKKFRRVVDALSSNCCKFQTRSISRKKNFFFLPPSLSLSLSLVELNSARSIFGRVRNFRGLFPLLSSPPPFFLSILGCTY